MQQFVEFRILLGEVCDVRQPLTLARLVQATTQMAELVRPGEAEFVVVAVNKNRDTASVGKPVGSLLVELDNRGCALIDVDTATSAPPRSSSKASVVPPAMTLLNVMLRVSPSRRLHSATGYDATSR